MTTEQLLKEQNRLAEKIGRLREQLAEFPAGKLVHGSDGVFTRWYVSDGRQQRYIRRKDIALAAALAEKSLLQARLADALRDQRQVERWLADRKAHPSREDRWRQSAEAALLAGRHPAQKEELRAWALEAYERNPGYPEKLIFLTPAGHRVRSKSEYLIDTSLFLAGVPFRYECAIRLQGTVLYPDFMLRHPADGSLYLWEHFGLMDDPQYASNAVSKLNLYVSAGFIPEINLILTSETREHPLNTELVELLIRHYFLS